MRLGMRSFTTLLIPTLLLSMWLWTAEGAAAEYVIGPEDVIQVIVWGNDQLTKSLVVRPDGNISFPLLNDIPAAGLTAMELQRLIVDRLTRYMEAPSVTVIVATVNSFKVYVKGEVKNPGLHSLKQETTLLEFMTMVGGATDSADLGKAYLLRKGEKLDIDFYALLAEGNVGKNVALVPGDFIFVPDNFNSRIVVTGEVQQPQIVPYREGLTVMDVLLRAGGFTKFAARNRTKIIRRNGDSQQEIRVRLKDFNEGKIEENILLAPGDTVIVPQSLF